MNPAPSSYLDAPDNAGDLHNVPHGTFCGDDDPPPLPAGVFHAAHWVPPDDDSFEVSARRASIGT